MKPFATPIANPENGEVLLEVKGANGVVRESYVLRMKTNAIVVLEQAMGEHIHKLGPRLTNPGMGDLRCLLQAALSDHHPEMGPKDAGNLIDRAGYDVCTSAIMEAFTLGFPVAVKGEAAKAEAGKVHGTGNGSSPTRRKRASAPPSSSN